MKDNNEIFLQVPLRGPVADMFEVVFKNSGLESRTECIRSLINKEYKNIKSETEESKNEQ